MEFLNKNLKTIIVAVIVALLTGVITYNLSKCTIVGTSYKETTKIDTIKKVDSVSIELPKPESKKRIVVKDNEVIEVKPDYELPKTDTVSKVLDVNSYKGEKVLSNGTVFYDILSEGKIFKMDYKLETKEVIITNTIEKETTIVKSGLFITGNIQTNIAAPTSITSVGAGLDYVHKNSWIIGGNINYNTNNITSDIPISVGIKAGFKL